MREEEKTNRGRLSAASYQPKAISHQLSNVFVDFDAQRLQELEVLIVDLERGICSERGYEGCLVVRFLALLTDADGSFEHEEDA
jgi:hypothetical protein